MELHVSSVSTTTMTEALSSVTRKSSSSIKSCIFIFMCVYILMYQLIYMKCHIFLYHFLLNNLIDYVAPEILNIIPYGKPCDMWSFGVLLYQLLCGTLPFYSDQQIELYSIICKGYFSFNSIDWSDISRDAKSLIKGLLTVDQTRRLTIDQAISHPWFSKHDQLKKYQERHERKFATAVASKE